jgi:hypothetical protein
MVNLAAADAQPEISLLFLKNMVRPGGLELPTFWFPPEADSIQLRSAAGSGCGEVHRGLGRTLGIFLVALPPLASQTALNAPASMDPDSSSIWSDLRRADPAVVSDRRCIQCRDDGWLRYGEYRRKTWK